MNIILCGYSCTTKHSTLLSWRSDPGCRSAIGKDILPDHISFSVLVPVLHLQALNVDWRRTLCLLESMSATGVCSAPKHDTLHGRVRRLSVTRLERVRPPKWSLHVQPCYMNKHWRLSDQKAIFRFHDGHGHLFTFEPSGCVETGPA